MDRAFIADLLHYVACCALVIACIGCLCTTVRYGMTGKAPHGEIKMLAALFFISTALLNLSAAIGAPADLLARAGTRGTPPTLPDPFAPYINLFWTFAHLAACLCALKVIDAFEHPERGWGRAWRHAAAAGEKVREYAAGKAAEREERRTRANWRVCARASAED